MGKVKVKDIGYIISKWDYIKLRLTSDRVGYKNYMYGYDYVEGSQYDNYLVDELYVSENNYGTQVMLVYISPPNRESEED